MTSFPTFCQQFFSIEICIKSKITQIINCCRCRMTGNVSNDPNHKILQCSNSCNVLYASNTYSIGFLKVLVNLQKYLVIRKRIRLETPQREENQIYLVLSLSPWPPPERNQISVLTSTLCTREGLQNASHGIRLLTNLFGRTLSSANGGDTDEENNVNLLIFGGM